MKKSTTILYLVLLLGMILGACTPCDDGDAVESNTVELNQPQIDSATID